VQPKTETARRNFFYTYENRNGIEQQNNLLKIRSGYREIKYKFNLRLVIARAHRLTFHSSGKQSSIIEKTTLRRSVLTRETG